VIAKKIDQIDISRQTKSTAKLASLDSEFDLCYS